MLWVSKQLVSMPDIFKSKFNLSDFECNYVSKKEEADRFFENFDSNDSYQIYENHMQKKNSYLIFFENLINESNVNVFSLNSAGMKINDLFLSYQKKIFSMINCMDTRLFDDSNYYSTIFFATGTVHGKIILWEMQNEGAVNYKSFSDQVKFNLQDNVNRHVANNCCINDLSWNKVNKNIILGCLKNGKIIHIDINKQKHFQIFEYRKNEPVCVKSSPFNNFEYITTMKDSSYVIADNRCNKSLIFKKKKSIKDVNWIFSENYFVEIEKNGFVSIFDRRYIKKVNHDSLFYFKESLDKAIYVSVCPQFNKLAVLDNHGSILKYEIFGNFNYIHKTSIITKKKIQKIAWSPSDNSMIALDKKCKIFLVS
nr:WD40-repeat-containing domain [Cryptomonas paramecium]